MAIKSADQISIVDITDAYSVILTSESHTFIGSTSAALAGSATTQVYAFCGSDQVPVTIGSITCPSGVSAASNNNATNPTITISVTTSVTSGGVVKIPVTITGTEVTIVKEFSFSIAFQGQKGNDGDDGYTPVKGKDYFDGEDGKDGADAITISITTSAGNIFKNSEGSTTLTAHVYKAGKELSDTEVAALGVLKWYKDGSTTPLSTTGKTQNVSAASIDGKATYTVQLEG